MRKITFVIILFLLSAAAYSQETATLSGGVAVANAIDYSSDYGVNYNNQDATGFRITGTYEIGPLKPKKFIHGFSIGYILVDAPITTLYATGDLTVRTIPIYYAPKFMLGGEKAMVFVRAAIGAQFCRLKFDGDPDGSDHDFGFYGGFGGGGMLYVSEKLFLNLEYEWAYMSNTFYANGMINSVQLGIGYDFWFDNHSLVIKNGGVRITD